MKNLFYNILAVLGSIRFLSKDSNLKVLAYHEVLQPSLFEAQLKYLKSNYTVIGYQQLQDFLFNGITLPKNPLLITFDDGDFSFYENGYPLLKKYDLPAIQFVITDLIDTDSPFWWKEIEHYLGKEKGNEKVWSLKNEPNTVRVDFLNQMRENITSEPLKQRQLNGEELLELHHNKIVISNHSHTHPMFNQCDKATLQKEMEQSITVLKNNNLDTLAFAYPNGNYSDVAEEVLRQNGVKMAFLFDHKVNKSEINPLRISRIRVNAHADLAEFKAKVSGLHSFLYHIKK